MLMFLLLCCGEDAPWYRETRSVLQEEIAACDKACSTTGMDYYDGKAAACYCAREVKKQEDTGEVEEER